MLKQYNFFAGRLQRSRVKDKIDVLPRPFFTRNVNDTMAQADESWADKSRADEAWAVRWEFYGDDGVMATEGGGSIGMSREIAAAWKNTDSYKYYVISIEEALALREKYPCSGGPGWFRQCAN
jgi:hypothetical protein